MIEKYFENIRDFGKAYTHGTFGLWCATLTPVKLTKFPHDIARREAQACGDFDRYTGRVCKLSVFKNACSGVSYYACVKSECKREGFVFDDEAFKKAFPHEKTYCTSASDDLKNFIMTNDKNGQEYFRLYLGRKPTICKTFLFLDGHLATQDEKLDIQRFISPTKASKKQEDLGISNFIRCFNVKVDNVVFLAQGAKAWKNPSEKFDDFDVNELMAQVTNMAKW